MLCDGMDTYARTWLQFAFPICIWEMQIGTIMFISSQSKCQFVEVDEEGRALNVPVRPKYGSGKHRKPLLDAQ